MPYEKLPIEAFGFHLLNTNDLDPIYVALHAVDWEPSQKHKFLIAYWCFYHAGFAAYVSKEAPQFFWAEMMTAAKNQLNTPFGERWPRGKERRHARGKQGIQMTRRLSETYTRNPSSMIHYLSTPTIEQNNHISCAGVMNRAKQHYLFGDWIAFKIADMLDRCFDDITVNFDGAEMLMFKDPLKAVEMLWKQHHGVDQSRKIRLSEEAVSEVLKYLSETFWDYKAPPMKDRSVGFQEIETILCKWKSHMNGHYPLYNDIDEITHGLQPWLEHSEAAKQFLEAMPVNDRIS